MTKKIGGLLLGFIFLYYVLSLAYDLPNLVNGNPSFQLLPSGFLPKLYRVIDILISFLFTLLTYVLLFKYHPAGKSIRAVVLILISVVLIFFLHYKVTEFITPYAIRLRTFFLQTLFFDAVFVFYAIIFYFIRYSYFREMQQKELVMQNRQAELLFLRSQLNPHFLFNSLNNIYALVYANSRQALPAISGLSELLRYMLYSADDKVPLEKELEYIRKYIGLQKLRFEHTIRADLIVTGPTENVTIAPLVLIPFIENAFKHGDFTGNESGLVVTLQIRKNKLDVYFINKKGNHQKDSAGGIGLENVKRRLGLLYPGKHSLLINDNDDSFTVNLELIYE